MAKLWRALLVSVVAACTAAFLWSAVSNWRKRTAHLGARLTAERTGGGLDAARTRVDEIDALDDVERELMLRELSSQV